MSSPCSPSKTSIMIDQLINKNKKPIPKDCPICMEVIGKDNCCTLKCKHNFHLECIFELYRQNSQFNNKCPLCRNEFTKNKTTRQTTQETAQEILERVERIDRLRQINGQPRRIRRMEGRIRGNLMGGMRVNFQENPNQNIQYFNNNHQNIVRNEIEINNNVRRMLTTSINQQQEILNDVQRIYNQSF